MRDSNAAKLTPAARGAFSAESFAVRLMAANERDSLSWNACPLQRFRDREKRRPAQSRPLINHKKRCTTGRRSHNLQLIAGKFRSAIVRMAGWAHSRPFGPAPFGACSRGSNRAQSCADTADADNHNPARQAEFLNNASKRQGMQRVVSKTFRCRKRHLGGNVGLFEERAQALQIDVRLGVQ